MNKQYTVHDGLDYICIYKNGKEFTIGKKEANLICKLLNENENEKQIQKLINGIKKHENINHKRSL